MAVTSHDVARLAGVSQPTVSRALRGAPDVSERTRAKVLDAARKLDYQPSEAGRALSTRSTRQVAFVADLDNPLYPRLVGPIHDALWDAGYRMVILAGRGDENSTHERLVDRSVDGAILSTITLRSVLPLRLQDRRIPFVQFNRTSDLLLADSVVADNEGGAAQVAQLLLEHGHERVGMVAGPVETSTSRARELGFRRRLEEAGLTMPAQWIWRGDYDYDSGFAGFQQLMSQRPRPTAVFCANDMVAVGALNAATAMGLRVPQQVSVVGFDDLDVAGWPRLQLTTVHVDLHAMARRAVDLIVSRLVEPDQSPQSALFETRLVPRSTHGRADPRAHGPAS